MTPAGVCASAATGSAAHAKPIARTSASCHTRCAEKLVRIDVLPVATRYSREVDWHDPGQGRSIGVKPSDSVCMKLTSASSSASDRPRLPTWFLFMLSADSGGGQHVVPSPGSCG